MRKLRNESKGKLSYERNLSPMILIANQIEYRSDDVTKTYFLKLWDMLSYSYRGS